MAINNTQTTYFTSGEIKFSAIRDTFGDLPGTDIKASDYLRNPDNDVDWSDDPNITPRVPNATENADVATGELPVAISETVNISDVEGTISVGTFNGGSVAVTRYDDRTPTQETQTQTQSNVEQVVSSVTYTTTSLYRYLNPSNGDHFTGLDSSPPSGYISEGIFANVFVGLQPPGTVPLVDSEPGKPSNTYTAYVFPATGSSPFTIDGDQIPTTLYYAKTNNSDVLFTSNVNEGSPSYFLDTTNNALGYAFYAPTNSVNKTVTTTTDVVTQTTTQTVVSVPPGTEGNAVGSIGYFVDITYIPNLSFGVSVSDTATRGDGLTASDNSIAVSSDYPETISSTRFKIAFDMTNSQGSGRQATYVRSFAFSINGNDGGGTDWSTSQLRDSILEYNITQSGNDEELEFADNNASQWNSNLSKNVTKKMNVTGIIYANETSKYALKFSGGQYNNLTIDVPNGGAIYGEGGSAGGGNGGGALYIENTATYDNVSITLGNNGRIWAGGGGGNNGNSGNSGSSISCSSNSNNITGTFNYENQSGGDDPERKRRYPGNGTGNIACQRNTNFSVNGVISANPNSQRNRCRGSGVRAGQSWNPNSKSGYACSPFWSFTCSGSISNNIGGGSGGSGGSGGVGQGFSNQSGPGAGNAGNPGNTNSCGNSGASSSGNPGNSGGTGGTWGVSAGGSAGFAIKKKSTSVNQGLSSNTVKGGISNI